MLENLLFLKVECHFDTAESASSSKSVHDRYAMRDISQKNVRKG